MIQKLIQKLIKTNIWNLVWLAVLCSEILTAIISSVLSLIWWGEINSDLLVIGSIDALVVSFIVTIFLISIFKYIKEIELKHQQEQLKARKLETVGVLAGGIAHDFNNILTAILGNINLSLLDRNLNERTKEILVSAEKASRRAQGLTQQLLTFAKGGEPVKETSSLKSVIMESAQFVMSGKSVSLQYTIPDDLWLVEIDKGQISQVIQNIVMNATHAMPGGGTVGISCENTIAIENALLKEGRFVKIEIADNGIGIPKHMVEKIFDPYFTTKQGGSGLGLAISQSIINKHHGKMLVESVADTGTAFTIYLPASDKVISQDQLPTENNSNKASKAKILIMDDEELVRDVAAQMLTHLGHKVQFAENGEEAIMQYDEAWSSDDKFDLVIMDLTVPGGMGGEDASKKILANDPKAKIIVSSGYSNSPLMASWQDHGFYGMIAKPYDQKNLSRVIEKALLLD